MRHYRIKPESRMIAFKFTKDSPFKYIYGASKYIHTHDVNGMPIKGTKQSRLCKRTDHTSCDICDKSYDLYKTDSEYKKYVRRRMFKYILEVISDSNEEFEMGEKIFAHLGRLDILEHLHFRGWDDDRDMPNIIDTDKVIFILSVDKTMIMGGHEIVRYRDNSRFIYEGKQYPLVYREYDEWPKFKIFS